MGGSRFKVGDQITWQDPETLSFFTDEAKPTKGNRDAIREWIQKNGPGPFTIIAIDGSTTTPWRNHLLLAPRPKGSPFLSEKWQECWFEKAKSLTIENFIELLRSPLPKRFVETREKHIIEHPKCSTTTYFLKFSK